VTFRFNRRKRSHPQGPREGVDMFNAQIEHKKSAFHLKILKNRINKLDREEQKARDKIEKAQQRVHQLHQLKVTLEVIIHRTTNCSNSKK